jgi:hypothetical protein
VAQLREGERQTPPPAVRLGITSRRLSLEEILARRLFPWRQELEGWLGRFYRGEIPTRCLPRIRTHTLRYAA